MISHNADAQGIATALCRHTQQVQTFCCNELRRIQSLHIPEQRAAALVEFLPEAESLVENLGRAIVTLQPYQRDAGINLEQLEARVDSLWELLDATRSTQPSTN